MNDIDTLVNNVFSKEPAEPNKYNVGLEPYDGEDPITVKDIFEFLLSFFTDGASLVYGSENGVVDLEKWGQKEIDKMIKYCESIGFTANIKVYHKNDPTFRGISIQDYRRMPQNGTNLKDMKFPLSCKNIVCVISFDYYKNK